MARTEPVQLSLSAWGWIERLGAAAADLLFPPHCVECNHYGAWFCPSCLAQVEVIRPPLCNRCGLPIESRLPSRSSGTLLLVPDHPAQLDGEQWICPQCQSASPQLDGARAYAFHSGPLRTAIHEFKYSGLRSMAPILGELMGRGWKALAAGNRGIDVIVPVPLHATRFRKRGFNQAALLARELVPYLRCPVVEDVLLREKPTAPQVGLGPEERRANVDGAFHCANDSLDGMSVLLVDDVYTTGSTLEASCSALHRIGVQSVWAYTLARAGRRSGGMSHINEKEAG